MRPGQELDDQQLIKRYLLGELGEEEQATVQDRMLCDRVFFDRLRLEENELMDDYLSGALTGESRERFKSYFLAAPERLEQLRFAKALKKRASESATPKPDSDAAPRPKSLFSLGGSTLIRLAAGAAVLLLLLLSGWLAVENARLRKQVDSARAEQATGLERARDLERQFSDEQRRSQGLAQEIERERGRQSTSARDAAIPKQTRDAGKPSIGGAILSLSLLPGLSREGGESNRLEVPPGTNRIRLQLYPEKATYQSYRAELQTRDGRAVWNGDNLRSSKADSGDQVVVGLSAGILADGDYILTLRGIADNGDRERAGTYYFRIVKR